LKDESAKKSVEDKVNKEQPKLTLWICQICEHPNTIEIPSCQNIKGLGVDEKYKDKNNGCAN
jgi:hypothetical protein